MFPRVSVKHSTQQSAHTEGKHVSTLQKRQAERPSLKTQVLGSQQIKNIIHDIELF